uniref:Uncharacterized protein n=1 Tax=Rhipicephalus appendiculatus TaxID=34631 RepID=A0A131YF96_RHIAP
MHTSSSECYHNQQCQTWQRYKLQAPHKFQEKMPFPLQAFRQCSAPQVFAMKSTCCLLVICKTCLSARGMCVRRFSNSHGEDQSARRRDGLMNGA